MSFYLPPVRRESPFTRLFNRFPAFRRQEVPLQPEFSQNHPVISNLRVDNGNNWFFVSITGAELVQELLRNDNLGCSSHIQICITQNALISSIDLLYKDEEGCWWIPLDQIYALLDTQASLFTEDGSVFDYDPQEDMTIELQIGQNNTPFTLDDLNNNPDNLGIVIPPPIQMVLSQYSSQIAE